MFFTYILLLIVLLIFIDFMVSHLYYHRSLRATITERVIRLVPTRMKFKGSAEDFEARMQKYERMGEQLYSIPEKVRFECSVTEKHEYGMQVFYLNQESTSDRILFYIHGGGNCEQPSEHHWKFINSIIKKTGVKVIAPLYPLLPFHNYHDTFPAITDLYMAVVRNNAGCRVILAGDSAGGGMALAIAEDLLKLDFSQPDELILISPFVESLYSEENAKAIEKYEKVCPFINTSGCIPLVKRWAGSEEERGDYHVSPIRGDMVGIGKTTIFTGTREAFYPLEEELYAKLTKAGVDAKLVVGKGLNHVFPILTNPEGRKAQAQIADIILRSEPSAGSLFSV